MAQKKKNLESHSIDITPYNFQHFCQLKRKETLRRKQSTSNQEIITATQTFFNTLIEDVFYKTFEK